MEKQINNYFKVVATTGMSYAIYKNYKNPLSFTYDLHENDNMLIEFIFNDIAMEKWGYLVEGICDGKDLSFKPKDNTYAVMFMDLKNDRKFWVHVDKQYYNDNYDMYVYKLSNIFRGWVRVGPVGYILMSLTLIGLVVICWLGPDQGDCSCADDPDDLDGEWGWEHYRFVYY